MEHNHEVDNDGTMKSKANIALIIFLIIGAFFLVTEHRAHLVRGLPYLPFLLLLACPLTHFFMHRKHGHGSPRSIETSKESTKENK